jgi:hypothetical protein
MKLSRLVLAVPAALTLAACGGGSAGVVGNPIGTGGAQANIRFVNGSPDIGNVDIYWQATGAAAPSAPASSVTANVSYAVETPFVSEPPTAGNVIVRAAGSSSSSPALDSLSVPIPQMAVNAKYSVVIAGIGSGNHRLLIFQDFDYSSAPQYRVHNASMNASATLAYSTAATSTPPGTPVSYNGAQVAAKGGDPIGSPGATYTQVQPAGPIGNATSNPAFVIGPNTGGPTFPVLDSLNASSLFASGSTAQPDTSGSLNFPNTAGTSAFAIDCTPASVAPFAGVQCNSGVALVGTFDTL